MFEKIPRKEDILGGLVMDHLTKPDKYLKNCAWCVRVANSPIEICFCSFGMSSREVVAILQCPKDCGNFSNGGEP